MICIYVPWASRRCAHGKSLGTRNRRLTTKCPFSLAASNIPGGTGQRGYQCYWPAHDHECTRSCRSCTRTRSCKVILLAKDPGRRNLDQRLQLKLASPMLTCGIVVLALGGTTWGHYLAARVTDVAGLVGFFSKEPGFTFSISKKALPGHLSFEGFGPLTSA